MGCKEGYTVHTTAQIRYKCMPRLGQSFVHSLSRSALCGILPKGDVDNRLFINSTVAPKRPVDISIGELVKTAIPAGTYPFMPYNCFHFINKLTKNSAFSLYCCIIFTVLLIYAQLE